MNATDPVLSKLRAALDDIYGARIERVMLYGSRARGDWNEDSDYDVAVFLNDITSRWEEFKRLGRIHLSLSVAIAGAYGRWPTASALAPTRQQRAPEGRAHHRAESTVPNDWSQQIPPPGTPSRMLAASKLAGFMAFTLPLMPVQAALVRAWPAGARRFPHWYHRRVCRLLGIRVKVEGRLAPGRPVLLIANHTSWLDIPVISAAAPVSFVAKKEVAGWPFVSWLARLQRTVFVDRTRRTSVGDTAGEMIGRLARGDALVLFAEGTSSDGNRVLPFKTSLLAAAKPTRGASPEGIAADGAVVQTLAIVYTHLHGLPLGRADRHLVGWYGDMELPGHAWELLQSGPLDVTVRLGPPVPLDQFADRKALARHSEAQVRTDVVDLLRGGWRK